MTDAVILAERFAPSDVLPGKAALPHQGDSFGFSPLNSVRVVKFVRKTDA